MAYFSLLTGLRAKKNNLSFLYVIFVLLFSNAPALAQSAQVQASRPKVTLEQRFATRWYASADKTVVVAAAPEALLIKAHDGVEQNDLALEVEQIWISLEQELQAKCESSSLPSLSERAFSLGPKGLFRLSFSQPAEHKVLLMMAQALTGSAAIQQVYPVLSRSTGRAYASDQLILRARPGQLDALLEKALPQLDGKLLHISLLADTALVSVGKPFAQDAVEASRWLKQQQALPLALVAEPNLFRELRPTATVNDPMYEQQWHLDRLNSDIPGTGTIHAGGAWDLSKGNPDVVIAVVDTGTDMDHPDLVDNIIGGFDASDGDNDPSAECSDSYDGAGEAASCPQNMPYRESHGTAVCGVAAGRGDNNLGTTGVCPLCSLMPVRLLGNAAVSDLTTAEMFVRVVDEGAWVINNSWGPGSSTFFPMSDAERQSLVYARDHGRDGLGTVVVFAAGNESSDVASDAQARSSETIAVAASTNLDDWAYYSNYGDEIDLAAPSNGGATSRDDHGIVCADFAGDEGYSNNDYTSDFGGTSSASPVVAGLAGLILSLNPALTADQVRLVLTTTAEKIRADKVNWTDVVGQDLEPIFAYDENGHSIGFGWGRVDASRALAAATHMGVQGALCSQRRHCLSCDARGRCQQACHSQADCPDGTVCRFRFCAAPEPEPTEVGQPCSEDCTACLDAMDNEFNTTSLCTDICESDKDCPSGFDCRLIAADGPRLCAVGRKVSGEPADLYTCYDSSMQASVVVTGADGQNYCAETCYTEGDGACPYGFHCGSADYNCTKQYGSYCFEYTLQEVQPYAATWYPSCFPDDSFGITCNGDDDCKLGDYCNSDWRCQRDDRAGCMACAECEQDEDCGPRGYCMDAGGEQRCAIGCDVDQGCPGDSLCRTVSLRRGQADFCLSPHPGQGELWCEADWTCQVDCRDDVPCDDGFVCDEGTCIADTPVVTDAGAADAGTAEGGGCACAGAKTNASSGFLGLFVLLGFVLRKRNL